MIFVTAGTTNFPFRRLEKLVIQLHKIFPEQQIIFQNVSVPEIAFPDNVRVEEDVPPAIFEHYLRTAKIIVAHAGYATVMQSLKHASCKPLIMPRLARFREHVNDHQLHFAKYMYKRKLISIIQSPEDIKPVLSKNIYYQDAVRKYLERVRSKKERMARYLTSVTL